MRGARSGEAARKRPSSRSACPCGGAERGTGVRRASRGGGGWKYAGHDNVRPGGEEGSEKESAPIWTAAKQPDCGNETKADDNGPDEKGSAVADEQCEIKKTAPMF